MNITQCEGMTIGETNDLIREIGLAIKLHSEEVLEYHGPEDFSCATGYIGEALSRFLTIKEALIVYNKWAVYQTETCTEKTQAIKDAFYCDDDFVVGATLAIIAEPNDLRGTAYGTYEKHTHYIHAITEDECTLKKIKR